MQEANAISFLPERQPRALTFITANAPTKKAGMYAGLPSFNDPVPWRPLAVLSHFFGCGSATVTVAAGAGDGGDDRRRHEPGFEPLEEQPCGRPPPVSADPGFGEELTHGLQPTLH